MQLNTFKLDVHFYALMAKIGHLNKIFNCILKYNFTMIFDVTYCCLCANANFIVFATFWIGCC